MNSRPPEAIDDMRVLYYADASPFQPHLKKYMPKVPHWFVVVYYEEDKSYCILGTDNDFQNWEQYTSYVFKDAPTALAFTDAIFRLPDDFHWIKV